MSHQQEDIRSIVLVAVAGAVAVADAKKD